MTKVFCDWSTCDFNQGGICVNNEIKLVSNDNYDDTKPDFLTCKSWKMDTIE